MRSNKTMRGILALLLTAATVTTTACGGGGGGGPVSPVPTPGPAPGTADLNGQLLQSGGGRVTSAAGDGLPGVPVSLINTVSGALQGNATTDAAGRFEFKGVPSGQGMLVKVEFTSSQDLNGDGILDEVELFFPVALADQAIANLVQAIGLSDSDGDGSPDSVEVEISLGDDSGRQETHHRQHRHRDGRTVEDSDSDGSFDDSDSSFDDSNSDGLPDSGAAVRSAEVRGSIEALGAGSITVGGITFTTTAATEWQAGENHHASPAAFSVGQWVKVEGFTSTSGELIAHEVKDAAADNGSGGSDDDSDDLPGEREVRGTIEALSASSITVASVTFAVNASTEWQVGENHHASPASFSVGQWVKVEGFSADGVLTAREVKDAAADNGGGGSADDDSVGGGDDGNPGSGGSGGDDVPGEREVRGTISAITGSTITVGGITFAYNAFTEWQVGDNHHASASQFSVGMFAKVEGSVVDGVLTAREVKDAAADNGGGGNEDDDDDDDDDNSGRGGGDDNSGHGSGDD